MRYPRRRRRDAPLRVDWTGSSPPSDTPGIREAKPPFKSSNGRRNRSKNEAYNYDALPTVTAHATVDPLAGHAGAWDCSSGLRPTGWARGVVPFVQPPVAASDWRKWRPGRRGGGCAPKPHDAMRCRPDEAPANRRALRPMGGQSRPAVNARSAVSAITVRSAASVS